MATKQEDNRKNLYNIIKGEFISSVTNKVLTYDEWFKIFFKDSNRLSDQSSTGDNKGNVKYNNLFSIINFKKIVGEDDTIIKYYFLPSATGYDEWMKVLKSKEEFYKTFACDLSWAQPLNFCKGNTPTPSDPTNLQDYDGAYKIDLEGVKYFDTANINYYEENPNSLEISFYENVDNTLDLNGVEKTIWSNIQKYSEIELKWNDINKKFEMFLGDSKINGDFVFNSDKNGFKFSINLGLKKLEGTGVRKSSSTTTTDTTVNKKKDTTTPVEKKKDEIPVVRTNTLRFNNEKKTYVATKKCDDFPFTLGCSNKLIGDLNAALFNGDRRNDVYNDGLENLLDNGGNFGQNSNKEITKELYDKIMDRLRKNNIIKETVKKVLKEYIIKK